MSQEIERKFLLKNTDWENLVEKQTSIKQGYLNSNKYRNVRVRITNNLAVLTVKGITQNMTRQEFEYEIPLEDAQALLSLCEKPLIEKTRYIVPYGNKIWEIDKFYGDNQGLIVAEIELSNEKEVFTIPNWVGEEVTQDTRYYNSSLITRPFKDWK